MRREIGHAELKVFHSRPNYFNDLIQLAYKLQKSRLEKTNSLKLTYRQNFGYGNHFARIACFQMRREMGCAELKVSILRPNYLNDLIQLARHHQCVYLKKQTKNLQSFVLTY